MQSVTKALSLKKNFSWGFLGNILYAITQSVLLIVTARLSSPEDVGRFTLALAVVAPIYMFIRMQLNYIYASDQKSNLKFGDYLGFRVISAIVMVAILIVIAPIISFDNETVYLIIILGISRFFESLSDICYGVMQKQERIDKVGLSKVIRGATTIVIFTIGLKISGVLVVATMGMALCWLFVFLLFDLPNAKHYVLVKPIIKLRNTKLILITALPLAFFQLLLSINTNMPRYFVGYYFSEVELGYFGAVSYIVIASINPISNALTQSTISQMSKNYYEMKLERFKKMVIRLLLFASLTGVLGLLSAFLVGELILTILFGADYAPYTNVLTIMMFSTIFLFSNAVLASTLTSMRKFMIQPILGVIWLITSLILCFILVPSLGLNGAALSVVISSLLQFIIRFVVVFLIIHRDTHTFKRGG